MGRTEDACFKEGGYRQDTLGCEGTGRASSLHCWLNIQVTKEEQLLKVPRPRRAWLGQKEERPIGS